jgi:hypothetical protein
MTTTPSNTTNPGDDILDAYNNSLQNVTVKQFEIDTGANSGRVFTSTTTPVEVSRTTRDMLQLLALDFDVGGRAVDEFALLYLGLGGVNLGNPTLLGAVVDTSQTFDANSTWDSFIANIFPANLRPPDNVSGPGARILERFVDGYLLQLQSLGDLPVFGQQATVGGEFLRADLPYDREAMITQFKAAFANFLQNYPGNYPVTPDDFFKNWMLYTTSTTTIFSDTPILTNINSNRAFSDTRTSTLNSVRQLSFEQIYFTTFETPPGTVAENYPPFLDAVKEFSEQMVLLNGYFSPTQQVGQFASFLQNFGAIIPQNTTLTSMNATKTLILNEIFALASSFVGILQKIAASQAKQLTILTKIQKAYTDKINQIPVFLMGDTQISPRVSADDSAHAGHRADLNNQSSSVQQAATANQQIVSDQSKALQASINQTNDAVTQQTDLIKAILQELSTILSSIFK